MTKKKSDSKKQKNKKQENPEQEKPVKKKSRFWRFLKYAALAFLLFFVASVIYAAIQQYRIYTLPNDVFIERVQTYRAKGDVTAAMEMLNAKPIYRDEATNEIDAITQYLVDDAPTLESILYFHLSRRFSALEEKEEAAFWLLIGTTRLLYDYLRCGRTDPQREQLFYIKVQLLSPAGLLEFLHENPEIQKKLAQRALDWDEQYPPVAKPDYYCNMARAWFFSRLAPRNPDYDYELRRQTRINLHNYIADAEAKIKRRDNPELDPAP